MASLSIQFEARTKLSLPKKTQSLEYEKTISRVTTNQIECQNKMISRERTKNTKIFGENCKQCRGTAINSEDKTMASIFM